MENDSETVTQGYTLGQSGVQTEPRRCPCVPVDVSMCGLLESISECDHEEAMRSANGMDDTGEENSGTLMRAGRKRHPGNTWHLDATRDIHVSRADRQQALSEPDPFSGKGW
ncbi:hypothetical protein SCLCIDRAFT_1032397 [Scleroderma citrinum Foug A]|uniref:Uncharacterized protein n=1 Tax=Scleroderma citrinum Foug A TaxID=1036808 RepID=A0A0C3A3D0_9AGAM|nr:hypothetical protein SCLCIDRAFT_1032397 [Scleroderma citrinum Foug A]